MDSKTIFLCSNTYLPAVVWEKFDQEAWLYVGIDQDFNFERLAGLMQATFGSLALYFVEGRHNSGPTSTNEMTIRLGKNPSMESFILWDISFERVLEFNHIGVVRVGRRLQKKPDERMASI